MLANKSIQIELNGIELNFTQKTSQHHVNQTANTNRLAYSHENGVVLVDVIQKCVILSANIADLYGEASSVGARDLYASQPFSSGSISQQQQQHHYHHQQAAPSLSSAGNSNINSSNPAALNTANHNNGTHTDNGIQQQQAKLIRTTAGETFCNDNGQANDKRCGSGVSQKTPLLHRSANEAPQPTANTSSSSSSSPSVTASGALAPEQAIAASSNAPTGVSSQVSSVRALPDRIAPKAPPTRPSASP